MSGLGDIVDVARAAHAELCVDTCVVTRPGAGAFNATTGTYGGSSSTLYSGACRLEVVESSDARTDSAEVQAGRHLLTLPWADAASATITAGDRAVVTSTDPRLGSRTLTVVSEVLGSTASARRFVVELVI